MYYQCDDSHQQAMSIQKEAGLCVNCIHAPECQFIRHQGQPVYFCNEYDCGESDGKPGRVNPNAPSLKNAGPVTRDNRQSRVLGLCSNCDNRATCAFNKPESGVWYCEEYR
jgi:hypothetical protein